MWGKDAQVRIDETKAYICGLYPLGDRPTIRAYLDHLISGMFNTPALEKVFSATLSTHDYMFKGRGDEDTRAQRRALVILRGSLLMNQASTLTPDQVMSKPAGEIPALLAAVRDGFHIWAMQERQNNGPLQHAFNSLTANPVQFLQNNLVVCQSTGAAPGAAINHIFLYDYKNQYFQMIPEQQIGVHGQQGGGIGYLKPAHIAGTGITVQAVNVPETYWADVPGRGAVAAGLGAGTFAQIAATQLTGANLMVTSAFSGCSFCFKQNGAETFAAHISPATPDRATIGAPPTLANQLNANGNFGSPPNAAAGALQVYGRGFANIAGHPAGYAVDPVPGMPLVQASMYVFGINNGGWRFYAQQNQMGTKTVTQLA